jgi:hypothetical protein
VQRYSRVAILATAAVLLPAVTPVVGAGTGGRLELESVMRTYDSRTIGDGNRVTSVEIGSGVFNVWAFWPAEPGTAVIHPCASPAPAAEATFRLAGPDDIRYARFATAEPVCITSTIPIHVIVDREGSVSGTPELDRSQYVPLPQAVELWNAPTTSDEQVVRIARPTQLSANATAAVVSLEVIASTGNGYVKAYSCSSARPLAADISYKLNREANVAYVPLPATGDLCVFVLRPIDLRVKLLGELAREGPNPTSLPPSWRYVPGEVPAPSLRPIVPERVLDSRYGVGRVGTSKVEADEVVELEFGDLVGPQTTAVVLNVTVTEPESAGFVTAWPCGGDRPTVSNLNFAPNETVPNLVVAKLGPGGTVCLSGISRTHLIADLNGTFETDGGLLAQPVTPDRILDTRLALGYPVAAKVGAGDTVELQVGDAVVPSEAGAVTVNVTVTEPDDLGFITAYPCDQPRPEASNLNYAPGQSIANLVTAKLSADGRLCLYTLASTHLIADIAAWYGLDQPAGLVELPPERFLDTRIGVGVASTTKVIAGTFITLDVAGVGDVADDADAVVMNITATEPEGLGFVTAWPCDESMPTVSNLNYSPGETNPNLATVKLSAAGTVCLYTLATSHLLADVAGYFTDETVAGQALTLQ